jgi:SAM-dependent methyltransferase
LDFLNKFGKFGGDYLDLGCGAGNFIKAWHDKFDQLIGIDFSAQMVKLAQEQCRGLKNIEIFNDNVLNFEKYVKDKKFRFIFLGGCFMYLNDSDVTNLINRLFQKLADGGVLIFREPTATEKRICEKNIGIRRTIKEYTELIGLDKSGYALSCYQNYSVNYTHFIGLYLKLFPFLSNRIKVLNNLLVEWFFLYLPLKLYAKIKKNMVFYHFFVINK